MLPLRFCTFGILSLWNESYPVSQLCHYVILKPQILAGLFFCPFVGGITCDRMLGSGFYMLGDGTVFLCVFLYFVLGCSWILSGFALKLLVRARGHLSNSTMARDFTNDGMVPSVLLVALFQPQWLTHRLAPIIHCEESESLCLQVCRHCHLSTIYLPAPLPLLRPTSCFLTRQSFITLASYKVRDYFLPLPFLRPIFKIKRLMTFINPFNVIT